MPLGRGRGSNDDVKQAIVVYIGARGAASALVYKVKAQTLRENN